MLGGESKMRFGVGGLVRAVLAPVALLGVVLTTQPGCMSNEETEQCCNQIDNALTGPGGLYLAGAGLKQQALNTNDPNLAARRALAGQTAQDWALTNAGRSNVNVNVQQPQQYPNYGTSQPGRLPVITGLASDNWSIDRVAQEIRISLYDRRLDKNGNGVIDPADLEGERTGEVVLFSEDERVTIGILLLRAPASVLNNTRLHMAFWKTDSNGVEGASWGESQDLRATPGYDGFTWRYEWEGGELPPGRYKFTTQVEMAGQRRELKDRKIRVVPAD